VSLQAQVIPDTLVALAPGGRLHSVTLATPPEVASTFSRAHQLSGHTVQRLSPEQTRLRFARLDEEPQSPELRAPVLPPPPGTRVRAPLGEGVVRHHLTYPDRVVAVVRGDRGRFESLVAQDQLVVLAEPVIPPEASALPPVALRLAPMPDGPACGRCGHALAYDEILVECALGWEHHDCLGSTQRRGESRRDYVAGHGELALPLLTRTHHCAAVIGGRPGWVAGRP
jgi:hypothetical protein